MYLIYDANGTFFGGHSRLVTSASSFEEAMTVVSSSEKELKIFLADEVDEYFNNKRDQISPLN